MDSGCMGEDNESHNESQFDTSWIELFEDEEKQYTMFYPEKATEMRVTMLYINNENELEKIGEKMIYLNTPNKIHRNDLVRVIQDNRNLDRVRYKLTAIQVYNIDVNHTDLRHFLGNPDKYDFTKNMRHIEDYTLESTINCLQELNNIYIIFSEDSDKNKNTNKNTNKDNKQKTSSTHTTQQNQTKRVRFNLDVKKTRRRR